MQSRTDFVEEARKFHEAIDKLVDELVLLKQASESVAQEINRGESALSALQSAGGPERHIELSVAFERYRELRRRSRVAILQLGRDEGISISALARQIGISRQLAHRLAVGAEPEVELT